MMAGIDAIIAAGGIMPAPATLTLGDAPMPQPISSVQTSFADILSNGLESVDRRIIHADTLVRDYALGENVPLHQVTAALEEARLAVEIAMQVRSRLVETYRDFMAMQI
jgi:flagellar hook-basal body complex protein FliE